MNTVESTGLLQQIRSIDRSSFSSEDDCSQILRAAQDLCKRLEPTFEWIQRLTWQEPTLNFCLKVADDLRLFAFLGPHTGQPKTVSELASFANADPALLGRILRHLAAESVIADSSGDGKIYGATELSEALARPEGGSSIRQNARIYTPVCQHVPDYLKSISYKTPRDSRNGPFQQKLGNPGQSYFEWIQSRENEDAATDFNMLMKYTTQSRHSWIDVFNPDSLLQGADNPEAALLVDIGGGIGADVVEFKRRYPNAPGGVVLQDLSSTFDSAEENKTNLISQGIECQAHDFFAPQPIQGARIYFMGSIIHDWPDHEAKTILRQIVLAMTKGYSTLLLCETVIPMAGCHPHLSALDLTMMMLFGAQERSEEDWKTLLESEGLKVVAVHRAPSSLKSVLQIEKV